MKERIRALRKDVLNLTLEEFGKRIGMKKNSLSQIENGINSITDQTVLSICREFNVNEDWLREGSGDMLVAIGRQTEIARLTKQLLNEDDDSFKNRLISVLANLTENQWEVLAEVADKLAKEKD